MNNETEGTVCVAMLAALIIGMLIYAVFFESDKTIPSEEQKPRMQDEKTEVLTHVIRCTTFVNNTCTAYKVYNIVRE